MVQIPFQDLVPVHRGSRVSNAPPFDARRIATFGLLISNKQAGPFRLEIERILAYHCRNHIHGKRTISSRRQMQQTPAQIGRDFHPEDSAISHNSTRL
jgi:hypothetical protein